MKRYLVLFALVSLIFTGSAMAMEGMDHGESAENGEFTYMAMAGDIHAEFKVMDLAGMNMKDPDGKTHHVMATFTRDGEKITEIVGKVKLVSPGNKEQIVNLQDYGEPGKWGVICLFKDGDAKQTVKFWYPHMAM